MKLQATRADLVDRDPSFFETDKAAPEALVQTAVNVELFTIPLYMTSLYSIQGMHQITGNNNLYEGRLWPGLAPTYKPGNKSFNNIKENEVAFNTIFSVFVEEMLHLQLASNLAKALGVTPKFTLMSPAPEYAWTVYSANSTVIPGIVDFKDCKPEYKDVNYSHIRVKLDELNDTQNDLFLAIEAPEEDAIGRIKPEYCNKYIHTAPLKDWKKGQELPMLGSIGLMYQLIWDYLDLTYTDNTTLFEKVYSPGALQQDIFNASSPSHPYREYQGFETTIEGWTPERAKEVVFKLISAITDQGEGAGIKKSITKKSFGLQAVQPDYQASELALETDYPSYTDSGKQAPSSHAYARSHNDKKDHYERFMDIRDDLRSGKIVTWPTWHSKGNQWKDEDLKTADYDKNNYNLPKAEDIAGALNRLNDPNGTGDPNDPKRLANYKQFCEIATGAIAGITSVLDTYWKDGSVGFPFPSMGGSGDRLMMCWAVFGQVPDLSVPVQQKQKDKLYHSCQGINYTQDQVSDNNCASAEIYHNCRGSNSCRGEGGCGFVQQVGQSKTCSQSVLTVKNSGPLCGGPKPPKPDATLYSAPGDNLCASFGGCAVPISASQIFPLTTVGKQTFNSGTMQLNDFELQSDGSYKTVPLPDGKNQITFRTGDLVHDVAWQAYVNVLAYRNPDQPTPEKPEPSDIRLAFPPST